MESNDFICLGKLVKTFGFQGGLLAVFEAKIPLKKLKKAFVFVEIEHERVPFYITALEKKHQNLYYLVLEDVNSEEHAKKLAGSSLYLHREQLEKSEDVKLPSEAYLGYDVIDEVKGFIGKTSQIMDLPQQKIMQIIHEGREILIPFHKSIIRKINKASKQILIKAPEGLIDFYIK